MKEEDNIDNAFKQSLRVRGDKIQEEGNRGNWTKREAIEGVAATAKRPAVVRLTGHPAEARSKPTDARAILVSQILDDTGKSYAKIFWPMEFSQTVLWRDPATGLEIPVHTFDADKPDKEYILHQFMDAVMAGEWENVEEGTGEFGKKKDLNKVFVHHGHPIWQRVRFNQKPGKKPTQFRYSKKVALNCIDRADNWCAENDHYKMLSSSVAESADSKGQMRTFVEPGISMTAYNTIIDQLIENLGNWANYDTILSRSSDDNDKATKIACIRDAAIPKYAREIGKDGPMTAKEMAYVGYNFDTEFAFTSYYKLKKVIGKAFMQWDNDHKTTFTEQLDELLEIEKKERVEKKAATEPARAPQGTQAVQGNKPAPVPAKKAPPVVNEDEVYDEEEIDEEHEAATDAHLHQALAKDDASFEQASRVGRAEPATVIPTAAPVPTPAPTAKPAPAKRTPAQQPLPAGKLPPTDENFRRFMPFWDKLKPIDRQTMIEEIAHINPDGTLDFKPGIKAAECDNPDCFYPGTEEKTVTPMTLNNCPVCFYVYDSAP